MDDLLLYMLAAGYLVGVFVWTRLSQRVNALEDTILELARRLDADRAGNV